MDTRRNLRDGLTGSLIAGAVLALLYAARLESYLLFHSLAELFAIIVSAGIFMILWNSRRFVENQYLLILGVASLAVGFLDMVHLLTYKGMGVFPGVSTDVPTQLWVAARGLQAIALVVAPAFLRKKLNMGLLLSIWTMAVVLTLAAILWWQVFPSCLGSEGLTTFKVIAEYVISALFLIALILLRGNAERFQPQLLKLLSRSIGITVLSELCFTLYTDPYGPFNLFGHYLRILAVYLLYKAIIETALNEPNAVLFRELDETNRTLREREARIRREAELAQTLSVIDAAVGSTLDLDQILSRALLGAAEAVHADTAAISVREGARWRVSHVYRLTGLPVGTLLDEKEGRHLFEAAAQHAPVMVRDTMHDARVNTAFAERLGIHSLLTVPLSSGGQVFGILTFHLRSPEREFRDSDREFAARLAISLALAFENARMYTAQREIADTLQGAMLTFPDALPGLALGHAYRSADELALSGGDFYDAFVLDDDRIALVLGDVAGKGIAAAAASSTVRTTLHAFSVPGARPSDVLASANEALVRLLPESVFATATYAIVDTATGIVDLCSAGHPDPFVCTSTGCISHDALRNRPLGIWPDATFEEFQIKMNVGDAFVMFSDGLPDARRGREFFGEERIHQILDTMRDAAPQLIVDSLMREVTAFSGEQHTDDIAILAASVLPAH
ncbi:MAG: hypothetical protein CVT66_03700 [Actinobacteria bacterium HGW-Actinobacteria-6]|nr:MAG: hypothetical protein CVT66_03700 [Actinobacteria bacterium HGW-Actinobacteria-6]